MVEDEILRHPPRGEDLGGPIGWDLGFLAFGPYCSSSA
jgi:hypothetical protein